ncbi:MAG: hypothetical protein JO228_11800 [Xanthobacteraceae bacterium]|nr:hypothetical protein [Xanthobacteraceae bacterium]
MHPRCLRVKIPLFGLAVGVLSAAHFAFATTAFSASRFHLEEASIGAVQRAIRAKEITAALPMSMISVNAMKLNRSNVPRSGSVWRK